MAIPTTHPKIRRRRIFGWATAICLVLFLGLLAIPIDFKGSRYSIFSRTYILKPADLATFEPGATSSENGFGSKSWGFHLRLGRLGYHFLFESRSSEEIEAMKP